AANSLTLVGLDGQIKSTWGLPDFVSDIAVSESGALLLSRATANQVAKLVPATDSGPMTPQKLFDATCPTALRVSGGQIIVVTNAPDPDFDNAFTMLRARDDGSAPAKLGLGAPTYQVPTESMPPAPGQPS